MPSSSSPSTIQIQLSPKPRFCIKTSTLPGAVISPPTSGAKEKSTSNPTSVPEGLKVFVNIAWDPNAPPSPQGSEEAILRAIQGENVEDEASGFYIPAVVSSAREERDKAGKPSLVFDCIYNTTLKARLTSDPEVREFLIELSLQRIESQTGLILSREIKTPNISSKGKLLPRTAQVPAALLLETPLVTTSSIEQSPVSVSKPITVTQPTPVDGIPDNAPPTNAIVPASNETSRVEVKLPPLDWCWSKDNAGRLRIEVNVPDITSSLVQRSSLDIEPRRLELCVPDRGSLEVDLDLSDAEMSSCVKQSLSELKPDPETREEEETMRRLQLKRERDFEVEKAAAEWMVGTRTIIIYL